MKRQYIIPIFVPHLGCPNDCIFCNQKSISGQKNEMTKEKADIIIKNYLKSINEQKEDAQIEIAFFGGTNAGKSTIIESLRIIFDDSKQMTDCQLAIWENMIDKAEGIECDRCFSMKDGNLTMIDDSAK